VAGNIFRAALEILDGGGNAALVSIVSAEGFVPVSATSKLLATSTDTLMGRSGSDVLDADIRAEAQRVMAQGPHSSREFRVLEKDAVASGWYRSWTAALLIEPVQEQGHEILRALVALEGTRHRGTLATILTEHQRYPVGCRKLLVCDNGTTIGGLGDVQLEALVQHRGQEVLLGEQSIVEDYHTEEGSTLQLLLEPILPTPRLSVFGGGHIVSPLVRAATLAGFRVRVIDDDPAFVNQERFPDADATIVMAFHQVFPGDHKTQWPLRSCKRLTIPTIREQHHAVSEGWVKLRQGKHHAIAIGRLDQKVGHHMRATELRTKGDPGQPQEVDQRHPSEGCLGAITVTGTDLVMW
jgi:xanthine/CO dehydrogenase XdhC/CoxF family maturation factor